MRLGGDHCIGIFFFKNLSRFQKVNADSAWQLRSDSILQMASRQARNCACDVTAESESWPQISLLVLATMLWNKIMENSQLNKSHLKMHRFWWFLIYSFIKITDFKIRMHFLGFFSYQNSAKVTRLNRLQSWKYTQHKFIGHDN